MFFEESGVEVTKVYQPESRRFEVKKQSEERFVSGTVYFHIYLQ